MANFYVISGIISFIINFVIGVFVYLKNPRKSIYKYFALFSLTVSGWSVGSFFENIIVDKQIALSVLRCSYLFAVWLPAFYIHYIYLCTGILNSKRQLLKTAYIVSGILTPFVFTPLFINGFRIMQPWQFYISDPGPVYYIFAAFFAICTTEVLLGCYTAMKRSSGLHRVRLAYLTLTNAIAITAGLEYFSRVFGIFKSPPTDDYILVVYFLVFAYAIIRHRLLDISLVLTRTSIFIFVYSLVLGIPFASALFLKTRLSLFLGSGWWMLPLILMAILATIGPFIYIYFERKAEEKLLREQRRYQSVLKQASVGMTRVRNLNRLLYLISRIITKTVKISFVSAYLMDSANNDYVLQVKRGKEVNLFSKIPVDNVLISWLKLKNTVLVYEDVKRLMMDNPGKDPYQQLEENMRGLSASLIIPSFLEDKLMGFFVLGDKLSGQIYTPDDLNVFQVLASQAALAIENAKFYEDTKEMQEQISQAEKMATIGTMADGLSHQINNRFYALSLISGDSIDTIKRLDTSKCSSEVQETFKEISDALERIQANVLQGGEVVKGMLKYTRKGEAGLESLELNTIVDNTLEMVQFKVKLSEIDLIRDFGNIPKIKGNLTQLEEVFFNLIDNAYEAILERRSMLKEEEYRGRVIIKAEPSQDNYLKVTVEDNGMGMKEETAPKVFTPFFTTKSSARKGTGLGLYVIKRLVVEMHKGKISFESQYKAWTRFTLELPVAG